MAKQDIPRPTLPFEDPNRTKGPSDALPPAPDRAGNGPDEREARGSNLADAIEQQGAYAKKFKDILDDLDAAWAEYDMGFGSLTHFPPFSQKTALLLFTGLVSGQKTYFLYRGKLHNGRLTAYIEKTTGSGRHHGDKINVDAITECAQAIFDRIVDDGAPMGDFSDATPDTNDPLGWVGGYYDNRD